VIAAESSGVSAVKSKSHTRQVTDLFGSDNTTKWGTPLIQHVGKKKECLKYDKLDDRRYSPKRPRSDAESNQAVKKSKKRISFDEAVDVVSIPAKDEYEGPVREKIWASVDEIHQNAARNTVEFISEGWVEQPVILRIPSFISLIFMLLLLYNSWNWRNVMEDEGMYLCVVTGERIHPIHYANLGIEPGEFVP
jgi:hypothetical protein